MERLVEDNTEWVALVPPYRTRVFLIRRLWSRSWIVRFRRLRKHWWRIQRWRCQGWRIKWSFKKIRRWWPSNTRSEWLIWTTIFMGVFRVRVLELIWSEIFCWFFLQELNWKFREERKWELYMICMNFVFFIIFFLVCCWLVPNCRTVKKMKVRPCVGFPPLTHTTDFFYEYLNYSTEKI